MSAISSALLEMDWKLRSYINLRDLIGQLSVIVDDERRQKFINDFSGLAAEVLHLFSEEQVPAKSSTLKVAIIGDFSSGKSSFINSLFGEKFCPDSVAPTTSCISTFRYSDEERIRYVEAGEYKNISREKYRELSCHQPGSEQGGARHVFEVGYPCEVLRGIEIIDTPGFNNSENEFDDAITERKCREADVVFVVMDIQKGDLARDLRERLETLKNASPESVAFYLILNKTDTKPPSVVQRIRQGEIERGFFRNVLTYSARNELDSQPGWRQCADIDELASAVVNEARLGRNGEWRADSGALKILAKLSGGSVNRVVVDDVFAGLRKEKDDILWQQGRQKNRAIQKRIIKAYKKLSEWLGSYISSLYVLVSWLAGEFEAQLERAKKIVYEVADADSFSALCIATDVEDVNGQEKNYVFTPYAKIFFRGSRLQFLMIVSGSVAEINGVVDLLCSRSVIKCVGGGVVSELEGVMRPEVLMKYFEAEYLFAPFKFYENRYFDDRSSAEKCRAKLLDEISPKVSKDLIYPLLDRVVSVKATLDERARRQYEQCVGLKNNIDEAMERFGFLAGGAA